MQDCLSVLLMTTVLCSPFPIHQKKTISALPYSQDKRTQMRCGKGKVAIDSPISDDNVVSGVSADVELLKHREYLTHSAPNVSTAPQAGSRSFER